MKKATPKAHWGITLGAGLTGLGVVLGAFGAHGLERLLGADSPLLDTWDTAVLYHLVHGVALIALAGYGQILRPWVLATFVAGIVLFCGSLYLLVLGAPGWVGPITPLGGVCFIAAWAATCWYSLTLATD